MISPNNIKLFSIHNSRIERIFSNFGFRVFSSNFLQYDEKTYDKKFKKLLNEVKIIQPHIFYFFKDEYLPSKFFRALRAELPNTKFVMRFWDQRGCVSDVVHARKGCIDAMIINNRDPYQYKMYKDFGIKDVYTLYNMVDENVFLSVDAVRAHEVFFGGSNYNKKFPLSKFRFDLITSLRKKFKTEIYGDGWPFLCKNIVRRSAYSDALQSATVNIGVNHYEVHKYYSERTIQNMASGRLHITHYILGMEEDFGENHTNLVWFKSIPECEDLVSFYLKNGRSRKKIERSGRQLVLTKFGIKNWTMIFSNILYRVLGRNVPICDY